MRSSGSSSATRTNPSPANPSPSAHKAFALTGRSRTLDPRTNAVRPDIADIRLAEFVFAPHYVAAVPRRLTVGADLRVARAPDAETLVALAAGEHFDLLDVTGGIAWGIASAHGLVGYVDAAALGPAG